MELSRKIINKDEYIPEKFYVFVNMDNIFTKNNLNITKGFTSAAIGDITNIEKYINGTLEYLPFIPNPNDRLNIVSRFQSSVTSEYRTEYNCEIFRKQYCPLYPSRLSAIYAFGDYESCEKASKLYGNSGGSCDFWNLDNVREFKLELIPLTRVAKVNMEIISLERYANIISSLDQETENQIWNAYWSGQGDISMELPSVDFRREIQNSCVIWEYLIEGRITLFE